MNRTHTRSIRNLALAVAAAVALSACGPLGASEPFTIAVESVEPVEANPIFVSADPGTDSPASDETTDHDDTSDAEEIVLSGNEDESEDEGAALDAGDDLYPGVGEFCATLFTQLPSMVDWDEQTDDLRVGMGIVATAYAVVIEAAEADPNFGERALEQMVIAHSDLVYIAETGDMSQADTPAAVDAQIYMLDYCGIEITLG